LLDRSAATTAGLPAAAWGFGRVVALKSPLGGFTLEAPLDLGELLAALGG
jgi:hypothetical protein